MRKIKIELYTLLFIWKYIVTPLNNFCNIFGALANFFIANSAVFKIIVFLSKPFIK